MRRLRDTWRAALGPEVAKAIEEGRALSLTGARLGRHAARAYPYPAARGTWPHKVWLSEVKLQLRLARLKGQAPAEPMPLFDREDVL